MKQNRISGFYLFIVIGGVLCVSSPAMSAPPKSAAETDKKLEKILEHYWVIEQSLTNSSLGGVSENAELIIPTVRSLSDKKLSKNLQDQAKNLAVAAGDTSGHSSMNRTRDEFKVLSTTLVAYLTSHPQKNWKIVHCAAANADWIQKRDGYVQNPFYGKDEVGCEETSKTR